MHAYKYPSHLSHLCLRMLLFRADSKKKFKSLSRLKSILPYSSLFSAIKDIADKTSWRSTLRARVAETIKVACCVRVRPSHNMHSVLTDGYPLLYFSLGCSPNCQLRGFAVCCNTHLDWQSETFPCPVQPAKSRYFWRAINRTSTNTSRACLWCRTLNSDPAGAGQRERQASLWVREGA